MEAVRPPDDPFSRGQSQIHVKGKIVTGGDSSYMPQMKQEAADLCFDEVNINADNKPRKKVDKYEADFQI